MIRQKIRKRILALSKEVNEAKEKQDVQKLAELFIRLNEAQTILNLL